MPCYTDKRMIPTSWKHLWRVVCALVSVKVKYLWHRLCKGHNSKHCEHDHEKHYVGGRQCAWGPGGDGASCGCHRGVWG
jgi:hypothetical protein